MPKKTKSKTETKPEKAKEPALTLQDVEPYFKVVSSQEPVIRTYFRMQALQNAIDAEEYPNARARAKRVLAEYLKTAARHLKLGAKGLADLQKNYLRQAVDWLKTQKKG